MEILTLRKKLHTIKSMEKQCKSQLSVKPFLILFDRLPNAGREANENISIFVVCQNTTKLSSGIAEGLKEAVGALRGPRVMAYTLLMLRFAQNIRINFLSKVT